MVSDALLRDLAAEFAARAAADDREARFPFENFASLHRHGLSALTVPKALGGGGADLATARRVISWVARGEPSTALLLGMQYNFQRTIALGEHWPEALKRRVGGDAVTKGALANGLFVEPELGSPQRGGLPATTGRRVEGGWRLSGHKLYSTGIPILEWLIVLGRTDNPEPAATLFVVHRDSPGISVIESWDHLGMRASGSHETVFTDVFVPADFAVPLQGLGSRADPAAVAWGTALTVALYDGIARAARDWLVDYLARRTPANLGAALATLPRVQEKIGTIEALLLTNEALLDRVTAAIDQGTAIDVQHVPLTKHIVTRNAVDVVRIGLDLTGNPGLSRHNPLERHYRDVLCSRIHTPQDDVILGNAGRAAFALV
ncbi:acyl-CoA dehydrogenase family protein [Zavarzinia compransoris]|uniref:Acyl-CoA dehydrogenase n=1 Tax=Zavarzinia compransoris TaxID=1264899 RepID=A0A317DV58_9PROT|nr:acyl-CoA dehydrogenase family protein [Zavarzinia compransoris]PWR18274.1 acyl-CoA dehydrogenase [Zavarzinia compransoris]TDP43670.1 alkylation response protein AidB-like acyl-CoA dehydrogenase [Zavarzinia compransoris]